MKKIILSLVVLVGSFCGLVHSQEQIDASPAFVVDPSSTTVLKISRFTFDRDWKVIEVVVANGVIKKSFAYTGATATTLMTALNKANCSITSMEKRILNQLIADGYISGTVSGNPD